MSIASFPLVPVSWGEIIDKQTILEIKREKISSEEKLKFILLELDLINKLVEDSLSCAPDLRDLKRDLYDVNALLWDIEDRLRILERKNRFDDVFIQIARSVYIVNDRRAAIKNKINNLLGSSLMEVKEYVDYKLEIEFEPSNIRLLLNDSDRDIA